MTWWHRHRKQGFLALLCKLDLLTLLFDSSLEPGTCNHVFVSSIAPRGVNSNLSLPTKDANIFKGDSVDYVPKARC